MGESQSGNKVGSKSKKFYIPASSGLIKFRKSIAQETFKRSSRRITGEKRKRDDVDAFREYEESVAELYSNLGRVQINASQVGDARPVSSCQFSPDQKWIATGSWSGQAKLWNFPSCENEKTLKGHTERVLEVAFHPKSGIKDGPKPSECNLATASADFTAKLWSLESPDALRTLEGHQDRLSTLAWHPLGRHIATTSFDHTWRLWDVETGQQLLLQEGHARETYGIDFQCDGALVATGDLGGVGRVWDLRSGKSIHLMQGHVKGITTVAFAPTGFVVATGGYDHTIRVVDLRIQRDLYTIPAHDSLISSVRFAPSSGEFLITSSFDCRCKLWSARDYSPIATFVGHEGKVLGVDIARDEKHFVSASYDRTWKLWAVEEEF